VLVGEADADPRDAGADERQCAPELGDAGKIESGDLDHRHHQEQCSRSRPRKPSLICIKAIARPTITVG